MTSACLILHIGAAKCGSSALQTALSLSDWVTRDGTWVVYFAVLPNGNTIAGPNLRKCARRLSHEYVASLSPAQLMGLDREKVKSAIKGVRELLVSGHTVIMSNEVWLQEADKVISSELRERFGIPFEAFVAIRSKEDYTTTPRWQLGAWSEEDFDKWVERKLKSCQWHSHVDNWRHHQNCKVLHVTLLMGNSEADLVHVFGFQARSRQGDAGPNQANTSLPWETLRLFHRQRNLRPKASTAAIDFALTRQVKGRRKTPWVMRRDLCQKIIDYSRADIERLCESLDTPARGRTLGEANGGTPNPKLSALLNQPSQNRQMLTTFIRSVLKWPKQSSVLKYACLE